MIRKTRLVKVIFGSCAAIFLILQFFESSNQNAAIPPIPGLTTTEKSKFNLIFRHFSNLKWPFFDLKTTLTRIHIRKLCISFPDPPTPSPVTNALLLNSPVKNVSKVENTAEESSKEKSPLSGERIHGLPNETFKVIETVSDVKIRGILDKIRLINEEQSIKNEDIFGPVTNSTTIIAVQVHNRLQYLRQLIMSLSQAQGELFIIIFYENFSKISILTFHCTHSLFFLSCLYYLSIYETEIP